MIIKKNCFLERKDIETWISKSGYEDSYLQQKNFQSNFPGSQIYIFGNTAKNIKSTLT